MRQGRPLPVPVPRLDLRPRRATLVRAKHTDDLDDFSFETYGLRAGPARDLAGLRVRRASTRRRSAARGPARRPRRRTSPGSTSASLRVGAQPTTYEVDANWKFIAENYSECYHCPGIHPQLNKLTPYDLGGDFAPERRVAGRLDGARRRRRDDGPRGRPPRRPAADARRSTELDERRIYYYLVWPSTCSCRSTRTTCSSTG